MHVVFWQMMVSMWSVYISIAVNFWKDVDSCHVQEWTCRYQEKKPNPKHELLWTHCRPVLNHDERKVCKHSGNRRRKSEALWNENEILTSKCLTRVMWEIPSWCRNVPKPIAAGALWRRTAKNMRRPSPSFWPSFPLTTIKPINQNLNTIESCAECGAVC